MVVPNLWLPGAKSLSPDTKFLSADQPVLLGVKCVLSPDKMATQVINAFIKELGNGIALSFGAD